MFEATIKPCRFFGWGCWQDLEDTGSIFEFVLEFLNNLWGLGTE
jgi:hypothetical protein